MPLRPQKYMCAPLSMRVKISSAYSATLSWMYILPPSLLATPRKSHARPLYASPKGVCSTKRRLRKERYGAMPVPVATMIRSTDGSFSGMSITLPDGPVSDSSSPGLASHRKLEQTLEEGAVRRDARAGGDHDQVDRRVLLRDEHHLARRAGERQLIARAGVAQEVGADALLGGVVRLELRAPVGGAAHAERRGGAGHVVTVARRRDRVQADRVRLAVLRVKARRDDAVRLALPVGHLALVVHDDVARLARGIRADDALDADDLGGEGRLVLVRVDRDGRLVPVRVGLEEGLVLRRGRGRLREGGVEVHADGGAALRDGREAGRVRERSGGEGKHGDGE